MRRLPICSQDRFKAHIVIEPGVGLVTAAALTKAAGPENSDHARGVEFTAADTSIGDQPVEVLGDSAYGSGEMLAVLEGAGHVAVIKPMPLARAVPGGFTIDDFTVDHAGRTVTCPAGQTRKISNKGNATFGVVCRACPLAGRCTKAKDGRSMTIGVHDQIKREHRVRATEADFQAVYRQHRPMVERSIAWMTRGARRVPYRGVVKNNAWWNTRAAGINLKRLLNLGLTLENGTWATA